MDRFYCEMADDEGAGNDPDMDRFQLKAWAYQRASESSPEEPIIEDQSVYFWSTAGEHTMGEGATWYCSEPNSIDIVFDNENHDFNLARLHLWGWARDYDSTSANENGYGEVDISGDRFMDNNGTHTFLIDSSDFRFKAYVILELLN